MVIEMIKRSLIYAYYAPIVIHKLPIMPEKHVEYIQNDVAQNAINPFQKEPRFVLNAVGCEVLTPCKFGFQASVKY